MLRTSWAWRVPYTKGKSRQYATKDGVCDADIASAVSNCVILKIIRPSDAGQKMAIIYRKRINPRSVLTLGDTFRT